MTSTNTYTDQKNYPYVYRLDNLITKEFYIGYRAANKVQSDQDLGTEYFTSAPTIAERFNEFQSTILAEFFNSNDAYDHEQYLIHCDWGNPLMLNKSCYYGKARFNCIGKIVTNETRRKKSEIQTGKIHSTETKEKISAKAKGRPAHNKGKSPSLESRAKMSASRKGKKLSPEHKKNLSDELNSRTPEQKAITQARRQATLTLNKNKLK